MTRSKRWATWIAGSAIGLFALTGLAHTKVGLGAIAFVTGSEGCPFGKADGMTLEAAEQLRVQAIATRVTETAPARPALGFALDTMHRSDIVAWTLTHSIACRADRSGAGLTCTEVDGTKLPSPIAVRGVLAFGFDPADRLVSVGFQSASSTPKAQVLAIAGPAMADLEQLGATSTGDRLDAVTFIRRETRASFADYSATVVASNAGKRWVSMQTFQSIPKPALAAR